MRNEAGHTGEGFAPEAETLEDGRSPIADAIGDLPCDHPEAHRAIYDGLDGREHEHCDLCGEEMTPITEGWSEK